LKISRLLRYTDGNTIQAVRICLASGVLLSAPATGSVLLEKTITHSEKAPLDAVSALYVGNEDTLLVLDRERGVLAEYKGKVDTRYNLKKNKVFESEDIRGITRLDSSCFMVSGYDYGVIAVIDAEGSLIQKFGENGSRQGQLEGPAGIDWSHNGRLYFYSCDFLLA